MKKKQIIAIEDAGTLLLGLRLNLISLGFDVTCFKNGKTAYEQIVLLNNTGNQFYLLITDIDLPGMNGIELVASLLKQGIQIPSVFISGYTEVELRRKFMLKQRIQFLPKPFSFSDLLTHIANETQLKIYGDGK